MARRVAAVMSQARGLRVQAGSVGLQGARVVVGAVEADGHEAHVAALTGGGVGLQRGLQLLKAAAQAAAHCQAARVEKIDDVHAAARGQQGGQLGRGDARALDGHGGRGHRVQGHVVAARALVGPHLEVARDPGRGAVAAQQQQHADDRGAPHHRLPVRLNCPWRPGP